MQRLHDAVRLAEPFDIEFRADRIEYDIAWSCGQLVILLYKMPDAGLNEAEAVHIPRTLAVVVDYTLFVHVCRCAEDRELSRADIHADAPFEKSTIVSLFSIILYFILSVNVL